MPTLRHIALIYQEQVRVEHYSRSETGWELQALTEPAAVLAFDAVGFEIALDRVYFGVLT